MYIFEIPVFKNNLVEKLRIYKCMMRKNIGGMI